MNKEVIALRLQSAEAFCSKITSTKVLADLARSAHTGWEIALAAGERIIEMSKIHVRLPIPEMHYAAILDGYGEFLKMPENQLDSDCRFKHTAESAADSIIEKFRPNFWNLFHVMQLFEEKRGPAWEKVRKGKRNSFELGKLVFAFRHHDLVEGHLIKRQHLNREVFDVRYEAGKILLSFSKEKTDIDTVEIFVPELAEKCRLKKIEMQEKALLSFWGFRKNKRVTPDVSLKTIAPA